MKAECTTTTTNRLITFSENRSKLVFVNNRNLESTIISVDGCQITRGIRCDYLLIANETEHFIELKGQDIGHAIDQLISTIKALSTSATKTSKVCYIICTRSPLSSASIQNIQVKFKKQFNSKLIIKSSPFQTSL